MRAPQDKGSVEDPVATSEHLPQLNPHGRQHGPYVSVAAHKRSQPCDVRSHRSNLVLTNHARSVHVRTVDCDQDIDPFHEERRTVTRTISSTLHSYSPWAHPNQRPLALLPQDEDAFVASGQRLDADVLRLRRAALGGETALADSAQPDSAAAADEVPPDPVKTRENLEAVKQYLVYMRTSTQHRQAIERPCGPYVSFQPEDETSLDLKQQAPAPAVTVFCHHDAEHHPHRPFFNDERIAHNYGRQLPEQIAGHINAMDLPPDAPVLLLACRSGNDEYGRPSAEIIARKTGRPVVAPNAWVKVGQGWMDLYSKPSHPVQRSWKVFHPDGRVEELLNVDNPRH